MNNSLNSNIHYDIIGDIHGEYPALIKLLTELGYGELDDIWQHEERKVIFLGDFIDRGKYQREVLAVVRPMIENKYALAVMGNHEFNAIAFFTEDGKGGYLRQRNEKNRGQHKAFLMAYEKDPEEWQNIIGWFRSLPLWLDLDDIRIVHACWDCEKIEKIERGYGDNRLTDELLKTSCSSGSWEFKAIETLLKGKEIPLPAGSEFQDKDGNPRHHIRIRWWDKDASDYRSAFMGPESALTHIPNDVIQGDHLINYSHDEKPVFLGHYWLEGEPSPLAPNIACTDYSVAKPGGKLVAYRWDGERTLDANKFVSSDR